LIDTVKVNGGEIEVIRGTALLQHLLKIIGVRNPIEEMASKYARAFEAARRNKIKPKTLNSVLTLDKLNGELFTETSADRAIVSIAKRLDQDYISNFARTPATFDFMRSLLSMHFPDRYRRPAVSGSYLVFENENKEGFEAEVLFPNDKKLQELTVEGVRENEKGRKSVVVLNPDGTAIRYGNLVEAYVKKGDKIGRGQVIGRSRDYEGAFLSGITPEYDVIIRPFKSKNQIINMIQPFMISKLRLMDSGHELEEIIEQIHGNDLFPTAQTAIGLGQQAGAELTVLQLNALFRMHRDGKVLVDPLANLEHMVFSDIISEERMRFTADSIGEMQIFPPELVRQNYGLHHRLVGNRWDHLQRYDIPANYPFASNISKSGTSNERPWKVDKNDPRYGRAYNDALWGTVAHLDRKDYIIMQWTEGFKAAGAEDGKSVNKFLTKALIKGYGTKLPKGTQGHWASVRARYDAEDLQKRAEDAVYEELPAENTQEASNSSEEDQIDPWDKY
jgi:hypothetical protein